MSSEPSLKLPRGRPRSPNPTVPVGFRVPKVYDELIEALALEKGVNKTVLLAKWVREGYDATQTGAVAEMVKLNERANELQRQVLGLLKDREDLEERLTAATREVDVLKARLAGSGVERSSN